ncbi:MAG TPA: DUF983 domain-containing protein [Chitinophagaceae bacterium]|nr:DUF983 domain-containing protein [Chitinophagaceae bacterium]
MCAVRKEKNPTFIASLFKTTCPHCRQGHMFISRKIYAKNFLQMPETCPVCGQRMEIERGFYYGTGYVSYAITVALSVATFIAWWVLIGFSLNDNRVFWWLGINAALLVVLQPWLMRLSRRVWLGFFVRYDANWKNNCNCAPQEIENNIHPAA